MKRKKLVFLGLLTLFAAPLVLAEDYKKEIPVEDAMNAFCGTWIMVSDAPCQKQIWNQNETFEWYCFGEKEKPVREGTFKIEKAWKDLEGNIWCIVWRSFSGNSWTLSKISNAGTVLEHMRSLSGKCIPDKIDPDDARFDYFKLHRK
jgi:hypothetical protein